VQTADRIDAPGDDPFTWTLQAGEAVDAATLADLAFAWRAVRAVKSNAILLAAGGATVGVGMGQVNRVDAARLAVARAGDRAAGSVGASDAFFPFADGFQVLADAGVRAVVEPGGSVRDGETIEAISDASDTPQATVYRLFASKLGILKAVVDVAIGGDDEAVAMADRPHVRALIADRDPKNQLVGFAALIRDVMTRVGPVHRVLADAARSDHDAATLLAEIARQRQEGQQRIARSLARAKALRAGLRERDAADLIHALASPEVYGLLVFDRGWSDERYEQWLAAILVEQLLA
jgi:AcrR family transcriptional regulator